MVFENTRLTIQDCKVALQILEEDCIDQATWRVRWVGAICLLRTVGFVLVDEGRQNSAHQQYIREAYNRWNEDKLRYEIYWQFIKAERDLVLKEYKSSVFGGEHVNLTVVPQPLMPPNTELGSSVHQLETDIYRPILSSFRQGDDVRDVYDDAIKWWESEVDRIEAALL